MSDLWPGLALAAASLQVVRNATQRGLTERLGVWGAAYVRFFYGLPFALVWLALMAAWRGVSGGFSPTFWGWILLGAATQAGATALLIVAMRGRAFAVATALSKTEVLGAAAVGALLIGDKLSGFDWLGAGIGTAGVMLMAHVSANRAAARAAAAGIGAGLLFAAATVAYRGAAFAWGPDRWFAAAAALAATLSVQTICGGALMMALAPRALAELLRAWRASFTPGAAGATSSALLFTAIAVGPSAGAVKTVQLADVLIAWIVSHRLLRETIRPAEAAGAALVLTGAAMAALLG